MSDPAVAIASTLKAFNTPADVVDFPNDPRLQAQMDRLWNENVAGWVTSSQYGDLWDLVNYGPRPGFYNPLVTSTPEDAQVAPITWNAFPGRLAALFPSATQQQLNEWADMGGLQDITTNLCLGTSITPTPYTPTGPRGWQDEYCEWSVQARSANERNS